ASRGDLVPSPTGLGEMLHQPCPHCRRKVRQTRADGRCVSCGELLPEELRAAPEIAIVPPESPAEDPGKKASEGTCERLMQKLYRQWEVQARAAPGADFYASIPALHRQVLVLWELHAQVFNGGFGQWIKNGYCIWINDAMATAQAIETKEAME